MEDLIIVSFIYRYLLSCKISAGVYVKENKILVCCEKSSHSSSFDSFFVLVLPACLHSHTLYAVNYN